MKNIRELLNPNKWFDKKNIIEDREIKTSIRRIKLKAKDKPEAIKIIRNLYPNLRYISYKVVNNCRGEQLFEDKNNRELEVLVIPDGDAVWRE
jgi:hypothetical protein